MVTSFIKPSLFQIQSFRKKNTPVVAKVLIINVTGLVSIVFEKGIVIGNMKDIDQNALKITMVPNKDADDQTMEKLKKFKWEC